MFSNICTGAGSSADGARPHLPTAISTSGIEANRLSSVLMYSKLFSTPACGMLLGMSKKEPSLSEGINSFPRPGNSDVPFSQNAVSLKVFHPTFSTPSAKKLKVRAKPIQANNPQQRVNIGSKRNFTLCASAHVKINS